MLKRFSQLLSPVSGGRKSTTTPRAETTTGEAVGQRIPVLAHNADNPLTDRVVRKQSFSKPVDARTRLNDAFSSLVANKDAQALGADGVVTLLDKLGLTETDFVVLVLLYKCQCQSLLDITRDEFVLGLEAVGASDLQTLNQKLPQCAEVLVKDDKEFVEFFKYVFQACREGTVKTIPKESAVYLLPICLQKCDDKRRRYVSDFCNFLQSQPEIKHIKNDEWISFLNFSIQVDDIKPNVEESEGHWPLILDSFVEWKLSTTAKTF